MKSRQSSSQASVSKPLLVMHPVPRVATPVSARSITRLVLPPAKHRRTQSQNDDLLETFQQSMKDTERRLGLTPNTEDMFATLKASFSQTYRFFNPSLEKNIARVNIMKRTAPQPSPSPSASRKFSTFSTAAKKNSVDSLHIDQFYQHKADSRAPNRLPLPGNVDFDLKALTTRRTGSDTQRSSACPTTDLRASLADYKEMVLGLLPHEDKSDHFAVRAETSTLAANRVQKYHWTVKPVTGNQPESREAAAFVLLDRKYYYFGGQSISKRSDIRVLTPENWSWAMLSAYYSPKGRIGHSLCAYKRQLVLYGGWSHYSSRLEMRRCYSKLYVVSLDGDVKWQRYSGGGDMPKSRRDHAMASLGASMLIFGGVNSLARVLKSFRVLDLDTYRWKKPIIETKPTPGRRCFATLTPAFHQSLFSMWDFTVFNIPQLRMDQAVSWAGFYLFGGLADTNEELSELWVLRASEGTLEWRLVHAGGVLPAPRYAHTATFVNQAIVVVGGRNETMGGCLSDLHVFRLESLRWEGVHLFGSIPPGRWGHCAAAMGSKVLLLGGISYTKFLSADLYVLETDQNYVQELIKLDEEENEKQNKRRMFRLKTEVPGSP